MLKKVTKNSELFYLGIKNQTFFFFFAKESKKTILLKNQVNFEKEPRQENMGFFFFFDLFIEH